MRRTSLIFAWTILAITLSYAQKKDLDYDQIFGGGHTEITKRLPVIREWIDDEHYVEQKKDEADGKNKLYSVDVKTGQAVYYKDAPEGGGRNGNTTNNDADKNLTNSPDGKWVAFTRKNNLYARELSSGKEIQFTSDGSDNVYSGYAAWVYFEEILGRGSRYRAFWWSPDSKHIAFMHFDETEVPIFPIYNSEGHEGFLEKEHYPKAGDKNPSVRIGIVSLENPTPVWADFNQKVDQYFGSPLWSPDGSSLWVQWMPRLQNTVKIYSVNLLDGSKKEIYSEVQKAWITLEDARITFINGGKQFIVLSDKSGWKQLYLYNGDGTFVNPVTQGDFTVTEVSLVDDKTKTVFFRARKENSTRFDFYRTGLNGKGMTRLTFGDYSHDQISLSPTGKYFITTYSNISTPPKMALVDTHGNVIRELGDSRGSDFDQYELARTELIRVKSADGLFDLPMTITYPLHFDPNKRYPVLVSIYGGPNAGTVYDRWNNGFLRSQWWAKEGMIQVAMDNRSSGHFGKMGQNYIYRQMGKYEIEDFMDCARWLRKQSYVDTTKVCITGGSFGGYMTCMALTYGADVFTHGIANSSVTAWELYDTHYTERFMSTPQDNPEGYRITSPQNYVKNYKGLLRITHGTMDDNVHMQNTIQFINKMEDQDKNFECM
ncbi:MAG TPA: DPP IV N-terminal domain-containing protein, partial [Puia sp.]|nr:DPP IV N-terminal domain-containing protein [Puia sp.]